MNSVTDEYESQLYGFSRSDFLEFAKSAMLDSMSATFEDCHRSITKRVSEDDKPLVKKALVKLSDVYAQAITEPLDSLASQLTLYMNIPSHVLLTEDKVHRKCHTKKDLKKLEDEINEIKSKLQRAFVMNEILENEISEASSLSSKCENLSCVEEFVNGFSVDSVVENVEEHIQKITALEAESANIGVSDSTDSAEFKAEVKSFFLKEYSCQ